MPELPDITVYLEALERRVGGCVLEKVRVSDGFVLRMAVPRITYAENEVNYCPRWQTGGKLLADRSLSRLLKADWPKTIEEAEAAGKLPGTR